MSDIVKIHWGEQKKPDGNISYDHLIGKTPIGDYVITWKGWKLRPDYCVDEHPFDGFPNLYGDTLEDTKKECQNSFETNIESCIK